MPIPFADLRAEYLACREAVDANLRAVIEKSAFIGGDMVKSFEKEMAAHQGATEVVSCGNGTDALQLALRALGVGPGDEVVTTPCTAIPTPEAITLAGASVVFADIRADTFHLDPDRVAAAVTPRTKAILPVHLYGIPCDVDALRAVARDKNLYLVEDCAQAQGARWNGERVGNFGDAGCFSFFPSKNLGGFGDGGALIAREAATRDYARMFASHGRLSKFEHKIEGMNSRLDALQAAALRAKLPLLDERNAMRRQVAAWYREELDGVKGVTLPAVPAKAEPIWHLYAVRVADRDGLQTHLKAKGIETGLHYPMALHAQPAYRRLKLNPGSLPEAEAAFREELSLPMFPSMTRAQVAEVAAAVREFLRGAA